MRVSSELRKAADLRGRHAERRAANALRDGGWEVLAQRVRTPAGELDLIAEREGLLAFIEVKARASLVDAAFALGKAQRRRLIAAAEAWMATNPDRGAAGVRFDVLLVDDAGQVRRIADAFRVE